MKRSVWIILFTGFLLLAACAPQQIVVTPTPIASATPQSIVELVDNNDDDREIRTIYHKDGFEDVYIEKGFAEVQFLCATTLSLTVAGSGNITSLDSVTTEKCPELLTGARVQIVNTQTAYSFDCSNCTIEFDGQWEIGKGVRVWRGTIRITPIDDQEEFYLILVPLQQP